TVITGALGSSTISAFMPLDRVNSCTRGPAAQASGPTTKQTEATRARPHRTAAIVMAGLIAVPMPGQGRAPLAWPACVMAGQAAGRESRVGRRRQALLVP